MPRTKSSEIASLLKTSVSSKALLAKNGSYTDPTGRRKSKRFKFTEPLSDSGSRTEHKDVSSESCKNNNDVSGDCVDGNVCNDMDESHVDEKDTSEVVVSACGQSVIRPKLFRKRAVSVVSDSSPNKSSKLSKNQKTVKVAMSSPSKPINDKESLARKPRLSPSHSTSSNNNEDSARRKVKEALTLFRETCRIIVEDEKSKPNERNGTKSRVDFAATKLLKSQGKSLNTGTQIMGQVPGVEVGDEFIYRMELNILGVHRPSQAGIDYMKDDKGMILATSVVASVCYNDKEAADPDVLIYTGQGGNVIKGNKKHSEPKDQELVRGNLALANSKLANNSVRVIKGSKKTSYVSSESSYVYDGLYAVEDYWQQTGSHNKLVFKFRLRRVPGQPDVSFKESKKKQDKSKKKKKLREGGLCKDDISDGKEKIPIRAVNAIDDEKPPTFMYTVKMTYPGWCKPIPSKVCDCATRCSESKNCCCVARNGGESPYNEDGQILKAKPLVYECGPFCKCPSSCYLRVTQHGIKFNLEIFKTESRGWGVRSRDRIPSGSFICEYTGEILIEKEAERLSGKDEYLFDIGKDHETTGGFTINAATKGNVGRFINHSCSPNLYAQDVLFDHHEKSLSHVMFFAQEDIPPLEELTYDYNYVIDHVRDAKGNIKKKLCHCGSSECTGRLY